MTVPTPLPESGQPPNWAPQIREGIESRYQANREAIDALQQAIDGRLSPTELAATFVPRDGALQAIGARSNDESIYIDTGAFVATLGNPVRDHVHRLARWSISRGQEVGAVMLDAVPTGWQTARLEVMWANGGDGSGDVRLAARAGVFAVGDTLAQPPVLSHTLGAPDRDVLTRSVLFPEFDVSKGVVGVAVQRVSSSLDTLPGSISFFGLVIERVT